VSGLILAIGTFALGLGWVIFQALIADELSGWAPYATRALIGIASRRLPAQCRDRYREEWLAEAEQLGDRPLTAFGYALRVLARAASVRAQLPGEPRRRWFQKRTVEIPALATTDLIADALPPRRSGPLVEWYDVEQVMRLHQPDETTERLMQAQARFAALVAPAPLSPAFVALKERRLRRGPSDTASDRAETASREYEPFFASRPGPRQDLPRRNGPAGGVDPEWTIAPLTRAERRIAEPYRQALEDPANCPPWPTAAREAFRAALDSYDQRRRFRSGRRTVVCAHAVRLPAFLGSWDMPSTTAEDEAA